jgi:tripartite-type tricarboxylate transporter receptor subunit TctC
VPYKGGAPALTDLIGGQVNVMFETSVAALPFVKQGKLRALAVSSAQRISAAPDLPTIAELGYPGFSGVPWVAIVAPANTPAPIVAKLNAEVNKALNTKELREQFAAQGVEPLVMNTSELSAFFKSELAWRRRSRTPARRSMMEVSIARAIDRPHLVRICAGCASSACRRKFPSARAT